MTDILSNVEKGDIAVLRSGAMFQIAKVTIDDDDCYPASVEMVSGVEDAYMMNGRLWDEKENHDDIVRIIKNPKGLDLVDLVCEALK